MCINHWATFNWHKALLDKNHLNGHVPTKKRYTVLAIKCENTTKTFKEFLQNYWNIVQSSTDGKIVSHVSDVAHAYGLSLFLFIFFFILIWYCFFSLFSPKNHLLWEVNDTIYFVNNQYLILSNSLPSGSVR